MKLYNTVKGEGTCEQIIEKSRFITYVRPVSSREEAESFFAEIRKKHRDATHNVPAMVLGDHMEIQWGSDDGEPQGTSGAPIVQMLVSEGITNVAIVVTRYFGGIKLGTGGLVRAYTSSAKLGLEEAQICAVEERIALTYVIDYPSLSKLQKEEQKGIYIIDEINYGENVEIILDIEPENIEAAQGLVANLTNGKAKLAKKSDIFLKKVLDIQ